MKNGVHNTIIDLASKPFKKEEGSYSRQLLNLTLRVIQNRYADVESLLNIVKERPDSHLARAFMISDKTREIMLGVLKHDSNFRDRFMASFSVPSLEGSDTKLQNHIFNTMAELLELQDMHGDYVLKDGTLFLKSMLGEIINNPLNKYHSPAETSEALNVLLTQRQDLLPLMNKEQKEKLAGFALLD